MRYLPVLAVSVIVGLMSWPSIEARPSEPDWQYSHLCTLEVAPGDAFTFVSPPALPHAGPFGRLALSTTQVNVTYVGFEAFPAAQAAFQTAVDIWSGLISSPVPINVRAEFKVLGTNILGSAGATYIRDFPGAALASTYFPYPLADRMRGVDNAPGSFDIQASFNSSRSNWYFGSDGNTPAGYIDFVSVVMHELGHGFGFAGYASVASGVGSIGVSGYPFIYDRFTVSEQSVPLLAFTNPSVSLGTQLTQPYSGSNPRGPGVYWGGATGVAGNGGLTPRLYTASTWSSGSSYSHLDDSTYPAGSPNSLMTHALSSAEAIHHPGPITLGLFADMGWDVSFPQTAGRDFNDDGNSDLLFQNGGQLYAWFMNGTTFTGGSFLSPNPIDANLQVVGVNDFTGDGSPDLLLQNQLDATVSLYKLNGLTRVGLQTIQGAASTPWRVVATGDFNGDSQPDIAWQHTTNGQVYVWFMSAAGGYAGHAGPAGAFSGDFIRTPGAAVASSGSSTVRIVGAGDMNNDGETDLVWQDDASGQLRVWQLNGTTRTADMAVSPAGVNPVWKLRSVGDYNDDQRPDLIFQNSTNGDLYAWFMNGMSLASGTYLSPARVNLAWRMVGPK